MKTKLDIVNRLCAKPHMSWLYGQPALDELVNRLQTKEQLGAIGVGWPFYVSRLNSYRVQDISFSTFIVVCVLAHGRKLL